MISVLILTLNEEANIAACMESLEFSDDIVVLDSGSTDKTRDIAEARGARVIVRPFDNWASHQNWALTNIDFKHRWLFYLDADERMTPALAEEVLRIADDPSEVRVGFFCGRKNFFMGRWIRRCYPPVPILRFFQPPFVRYERLVNPIAHVSGKTGHLTHRFLHYNFSKGLTEWIDKHNKYSLAEAIEARRCLELPFPRLRDLLCRDQVKRRNAIKRLAWRLPFRPTLKFAWLYLVRGGFLDGVPGLIYCRLQAIYEYFIDLKIRELEIKARNESL